VGEISAFNGRGKAKTTSEVADRTFLAPSKEHKIKEVEKLKEFLVAWYLQLLTIPK